MRGYFDASGTGRGEVEVAGSRSSARVAAVLDTGFDGDLCLPIGLAIQLGLELRSTVTIELADGSRSEELVFAGRVIDEGQERPVTIFLTHAQDALLGLGLLRGRRVVLDFTTEQVEVGAAPS